MMVTVELGQVVHLLEGGDQLVEDARIIEKVEEGVAVLPFKEPTQQPVGLRLDGVADLDVGELPQETGVRAPDAVFQAEQQFQQVVDRFGTDFVRSEETVSDGVIAGGDALAAVLAEIFGLVKVGTDHLLDEDFAEVVDSPGGFKHPGGQPHLVFEPQHFGNGGHMFEDKLILLLVGDEVQGAADSEEEFQGHAIFAVGFVVEEFPRQILETFDPVNGPGDPEEQLRIPKTSDTLFDVGLHGEGVFRPSGVGFVDFRENKTFGIVVADFIEHPLRGVPRKRRAGNEARLHQGRAYGDVFRRSFGDVGDFVDPVAQLQPRIPGEIEELLDDLGCLVAFDLLVDEHQVDVAVDAELFAPVASQGDDGDGDGTAHRKVVAEAAAQDGFVHLDDDFVEGLGMFDEKVLALVALKECRQRSLVVADILFEDFRDFEIAGAFLDKVFDLFDDAHGSDDPDGVIKQIISPAPEKEPARQRQPLFAIMRSNYRSGRCYADH